jgi:hypothetical protein
MTGDQNSYNIYFSNSNWFSLNTIFLCICSIRVD